MRINILETKTPIINCYTVFGAIFTILPDNMIPWVYNNFIQIRYCKNWDITTFDNHHMFLSNCPGILFRNIPKYILTSGFKGSLKDLIIESINSNQYIFMYVDRFYIKDARGYYNMKHFYHDIFIYGYDLEKNIVYIADNLYYGKFVFTTCTFSELEEAYHVIDSQYEFKTDIVLMSVKPEYESYIDIQQITDSIERYLYSKPTYDMKYEQPCEFGLNVINNLLTEYNGEDIDLRAFHLLYEHKILMEMRVDYLIEKGFLSSQNINKQEFSKLKHEFLILRNMVLKYNYVKSEKLFNKLTQKFNQLNEKDQILLKDLLIQLKC